MFPAPPLITVELVMTVGRDALEAINEIDIRPALLTLSQLIVPTLVFATMRACGTPAHVAAAASLVSCGILSRYAAVGRARRRRRDILLNLHGYWRQRLRKSDQAALGLLVDAMRAAQKNVWVLSVQVLPFTMLGLAGIAYLDLMAVASHPSGPVALSMTAWFAGVGVATWHSERNVESLLKHHRVAHFC